MNRLCVLLILGAMFSCSTKNPYEKAIADYVQTDKKGTWYDMKFKALEIKELQKVSVADSIAMLTEKMEAERTAQISIQQKNINSNQASLEKEKSARYPSKTMMDFYTKNIANAHQKMEELKVWDPGYAAAYDNRSKEDVLAIVVQCKYSIVPPTISTTVVESKNFILTPDGKKCLRMTGTNTAEK